MCMVFDFLPEEPTAPSTAAAMLRGSSVPGLTRQRQMRRVPRRRCKRLGPSSVQNVRTLSHISTLSLSPLAD